MAISLYSRWSCLLLPTTRNPALCTSAGCLAMLAAQVGNENHVPGPLHFTVPLTSVTLCPSFFLFIFLEVLQKQINYCP